VWIPNSHYAEAAGADDGLEAAYEYLQATIAPSLGVPEAMLHTYLEQGPRMLRFLHDRTRVRYESLGQYPDYFSDAPGARNGHRSMEPAPVDITQLHCGGERLRRTHAMMHMLNEIPISQKEAYCLVGQLPGWPCWRRRPPNSLRPDRPGSHRARRWACSGWYGKWAAAAWQRSI